MLLIFIIFAIGIICILLGIAKNNKDSFWEDGDFAICLGIVILICAIVVSGIAFYNNVYRQTNYEKAIITHDMLTYQLEENYYNKITYDGRAKLMEEIENYNKMVLTGRAMKNDMFIGAFFAMDYDSLPLIKMKQKVFDFLLLLCDKPRNFFVQNS